MVEHQVCWGIGECMTTYFAFPGETFALGFSGALASLPFPFASTALSRSFLGWKGIGGGGRACRQNLHPVTLVHALVLAGDTLQTIFLGVTTSSTFTLWRVEIYMHCMGPHLCQDDQAFQQWLAPDQVQTYVMAMYTEESVQQGVQG